MTIGLTCCKPRLKVRGPDKSCDLFKDEKRTIWYPRWMYSNQTITRSSGPRCAEAITWGSFDLCRAATIRPSKLCFTSHFEAKSSTSSHNLLGSLQRSIHNWYDVAIFKETHFDPVRNCACRFRNSSCCVSHVVIAKTFARQASRRSIFIVRNIWRPLLSISSWMYALEKRYSGEKILI